VQGNDGGKALSHYLKERIIEGGEKEKINTILKDI